MGKQLEALLLSVLHYASLPEVTVFTAVLLEALGRWLLSKSWLSVLV